LAYIYNLIQKRRTVHATESTVLLNENNVLNLLIQANESEGDLKMSDKELVSDLTSMVLFGYHVYFVIFAPNPEPTLAMSGRKRALALHCGPW